jgi:hypothetical protein
LFPKASIQSKVSIARSPSSEFLFKSCVWGHRAAN